MSQSEWQARWIWDRQRRTPLNTFVCFRRVIELTAVPAKAIARVSADGRYKLYVNGTFVARGPAPYDPRWQEYDEVDVAPYLRRGANVIAAIVVHFGQSDGVYVQGLPGFLFELRDDAGRVIAASDASWRVRRCRAWRGTGLRRSFNRALQEDFDAAQFDEAMLGGGDAGSATEADAGTDADAHAGSDWHEPAVIDLPPGATTIARLHPDVCMGGFWPSRPMWTLVPRSIPMMTETPTAPRRILETGELAWHVEPEDYFAFYPPDAFTATPARGEIHGRGRAVRLPCEWRPDVPPLRLEASPGRSACVTLDFGEQVVGFLRLRVRAPAGAIVEIVWDERRDPQTWALTGHWVNGNWVRYRCRDGEQSWETFDYETFRYVQVWVRGSGPVELIDLHCAVREYPWEPVGRFECSDPVLTDVWAVGVRTLKQIAQETIMDNVERERQQYSGEGDAAKLGVYYAFGDPRLPARMIRQYAQGQMPSGQLMSCWPSWDKLFRRMQGAMEVDVWRSEIVGHSLMWVVGLWRHALYAGDAALVCEILPNVRRLLAWVRSHEDSDTLLSPIGWHDATFWIDHVGFGHSDDWIASTNLYYVWMLDATARLETLAGDADRAAEARARADRVRAAIRRRYWSATQGILVDNPGSSRPPNAHIVTNSLGYLLDVVPADAADSLAERLAADPSPFAAGTPPTTAYLYWALSKARRPDAILRDLRTRWVTMPSYRENRTFGEDWDGTWCRCQFSVVPIYALSGEILGVRPAAPGFARVLVDPQPADLAWCRGAVPTPHGPVHVEVERDGAAVRCRVEAPDGCPIEFGRGVMQVP